LTPALDEALGDRVVARLRAFEPETTAVLLTGSYARGAAEASSDFDVMAITPSPQVPYRTWFEEQTAGAPLRVSAAAATEETWLARGTTPVRWSLGFPAIASAAYLWTDGTTKGLLGDDPSLRHPAAGPELEDFLDFVLKSKRCAGSGDELGMRWFAHQAALLTPTLLIPLNVERVVRDRRDALDAALSLREAPVDQVAALTVCLGLRSASASEVNEAVTRLGAELLGFLRERAPDVDPQPELARFLADGLLERQLAIAD
jgi:hypothetical protein